MVRYIFILFIVQSCLFPKKDALSFKGSRDIWELVASDKSPSFEDIRELVFKPNKCLTCHNSPANINNGFLDLTSYEALINSKTTLLEVSSEDTSMYKELASGSMPIDAPKVSKLELELVNQYIKAGSPKESVLLPSQDEIVVEAETIDTAPITFESLNKYVIKKHNCTKCHNDNRQKGGVNLASKEAMLSFEWMIYPDFPKESVLYTSIEIFPDGSSEMPPLDWGEPSPMDPKEVEFVLKYIKACSGPSESVICP